MEITMEITIGVGGGSSINGPAWIMASKIGGSWQQLGVSKSRHQGKQKSKKKAGPILRGQKNGLLLSITMGITME